MAVELDLSSQRVHVCQNIGGLPYIHCHVVPGKLPGIEVKPVVGNLDLVTVNNLLLEDSVTVPQPVTPSGEVQTRKTVEEAGRKATEATVAKRSIVLL